MFQVTKHVHVLLKCVLAKFHIDNYFKMLHSGTQNDSSYKTCSRDTKMCEKSYKGQNENYLTNKQSPVGLFFGAVDQKPLWVLLRGGPITTQGYMFNRYAEDNCLMMYTTQSFSKCKNSYKVMQRGKCSYKMF